MLQPRWSLLSWLGSKSVWTQIWPSSSRWTLATPVVLTCPTISRSCSAALRWRRPIASWSLKWCCTRRASELPRNLPARLCHFSRSYCLLLLWTLPVSAVLFLLHFCLMLTRSKIGLRKWQCYCYYCKKLSSLQHLHTTQHRSKTANITIDDITLLHIARILLFTDDHPCC